GTLANAVMGGPAAKIGDAPAAAFDQMADGAIGTAAMVGIDRGEAAHLGIDQADGLAALAQHGQQFRLEKPGAEQRIREMQAQLTGEGSGWSKREEGEGDALAAAGFLNTMQDRRKERRACQGVVLPVQQKGNAADAVALQFAAVVTEPVGGGLDLPPRL